MHHDTLPIEAVLELRSIIPAKLKEHSLTWQDQCFDPPYDVWLEDQAIEAINKDLVSLRLVEVYLRVHH
jgi:hypothetical protein